MTEKGGVTVLSNNRYYSGHNRELAHSLKDGNASAIEQAAMAIRSIFDSWDNIAIVPIPSHNGYATYTLKLAEALGQGHVYDVLRCNAREPLYDLKKRGEKVTSDDLGFYAIGSIPAEMDVVFLDNVVASGTTAIAAYNAIGRGLMATYAIDL